MMSPEMRYSLLAALIHFGIYVFPWMVGIVTIFYIAGKAVA